jgi:hypothetical protein
MRKKRRYGGLSPRQVRLIREYLRDISRSGGKWSPYNIWFLMVIYSKQLDKCPRPEPGTVSNSTFNALKAGLKVLMRKRIGRIWDMNPEQSFATLGITVDTSRPPSTQVHLHSDEQA